MADSTATVSMAATTTPGGASSIMATNSDSATKGSLSDSSVGQTTLYSSFHDPYTDSSQFPMQHATKQLPSDQVSMTTTEPVTLTTDQGQGQSTQSDFQPDSPGNSQSADSVSLGSQSSDSNLLNSQSSDSASASSSSGSVGITKNINSVISKTSDYQDIKSSESLSLGNTVIDDKSDSTVIVPGVTDFADNINPTGSTAQGSTAQSVSTSSTVDILPTSSSSSTVMSGDGFGMDRATKTTFSSAAVGLDSVSLKTTDAVPVPPFTGKPLIPEASEDSTILGGGLPDIIIYAGVPVCGLIILILLIVCIVCVKRRKKTKTKGSPAKSNVQDLWVNNSRTDVPLTSQNSVPGPNGVEASLQDDIVKRRSVDTNMGVRKRKVKHGSTIATVTRQRGGLERIDEEGCTTYEAVFDYKGELSTHLQLKQGDLVRVHRKEAAGWWRGTVGDQTGWFPSNYVQAAPPDNVKTENEIDLHDDSHITSFMLKKTEEPNQRHSYIVNEPNHRKSNLTEEEIEAEPIYCKIQPKDKRVSAVDRSNSTTPTKSDTSSITRDTTADTDVHYVALYPFIARVETELTVEKGDTILCKECLDSKGWMRGVCDRTKQEGWVPATYVQKIERVIEKPKLDPDPTTYKQLEVNTNMDDRPDLVGIVHRAVHNFFAEKAGDLEFETGDLVTVFQVLENGWWLGCKDKTVGWFPGSFVEMVDQPSSSPSPSPASSNRSPSESPVPSEDLQVFNDGSAKSVSLNDTKPPTQSKLKPVRKAPAPPKSPRAPDTQVTEESPAGKKPESRLPTPGGSRLPKLSRPKVAPPLPPTKASLDTADHEDDDISPLYDTIDKPNLMNGVNRNISNEKVPNDEISAKQKQTTPTSDGLYELIKQPDNKGDNFHAPKKDKIKPPVPKRYIKPKLVTVPKTEVQMADKDLLTKGLVSGEVMKLRSPPPPRPVAPKLGPIRAKLAEPKPLEDQIPCEEEDTYFSVTPQRKFDAFVCQDLSDVETEVEAPYQRLSSFGSFGGGSTFGKSNDVKKSLDTETKGVQKHIIVEENDSVNIHNKYIEPKSLQKEGEVKNISGLPSVSKDQDLKLEINVKDDTCNIPDEISEKKSVEDLPKRNESPTKTGIPVTPKAKSSKLPPPKQRSVKTNEMDTENVNDKDKLPLGSPAEKPSKLQKPTKLSTSPKIPMSLKESPRKKIEDTEVFQYPEKSPVQNGDNAMVNKETKVDEISDNARQRSQSGEMKLNSDLFLVNRPRLNSLENRPRADSVENRQRADSLENRPRTDSIGKPPVAPKPKSGLPKLSKLKPLNKSKEDLIGDSAAGKSPSGDNKGLVNDGKTLPISGNSPETKSTPVSVSKSVDPESDKHSEDKTKVVTPGSKIPLGSAITQQSPKLRGRKSNLPSPGARNRSVDRKEKPSRIQKLSESESDGQLSPISNPHQKPESPSPGRKQGIQQNNSVEKQNLRNRSNSPAGRTGIPTKLTNRSNSPAPKPAGLPVPTANSPSKSTPKNKQRGLVPPKKILNGQNSFEAETEQGTSGKSPDLTGSSSPVVDSVDEFYNDSTSPKPDRPSKPPRVQKQKSQDVKPPKHGKSLLPIIHKSMETGSTSPNGVSPTTPGTKPKRGIPVAKQARPSTPKSPQANHGEEMKRTLYQAVRGYTAQIDGELTFSEGTFIKELSDCDRPGWYVGMLADGTTGLYPADYFKPSPVSAQSEA